MTSQLRYEDSAAEIYDQLKAIKRTGWVIRGVSNPETVYDHTVSLVTMATDFQHDLGLTDTELDDLQHILEIHDWAESIVGDEYVPNQDPAKYAELKAQKAVREKAAMEKVLSTKPYKDEVYRLFMRYESGEDTIAKLAKQLDKYQSLELALEYEMTQGIDLFKKFDTYYIRDNSFSNEVLLQKVEELREKHSNSLRNK